MTQPYRRGTAVVWLLLIWVLAWFHATSISAAPDYWPTAGWRSATPESQGMDSGKLADMLEQIQRGDAIDSLTIIRHGYLVLDAYVHPFHKGLKHNVYSCTKSVTSALVGIALQQGHIPAVSHPLLGFFPERTVAHLDDRKQAITLEHLLTMTSGLHCRDTSRYQWAGWRAMQQSGDWAQYILDLPMEAAPGARFNYCNGVSYLLSAILQRATGMPTLDFARQHLFGPLGITDVHWRSSPQGVTIGGSNLSLTPHDMAKIGWLYLNHGHWDGRQVVPAAWVEASTRGHVRTGRFPYYGYQWWSDSIPSQQQPDKPMVDYYAALGYKGQAIFVVPAQQLVAVFTSNLSVHDRDIPKMLLEHTIIPAAASATPLPANPAQQARLQALVTQLATGPVEGFVWRSAAEGVAKDGRFVRTAAPAFQFTYPPGSRKVALKFSREVMRMTTLEGVVFTAVVADQPDGIPLAEVGPTVYASYLEKAGSQVTVLSNTAITLQDGTPAYRTDVSWVTKTGAPHTTLVVSAFTDGKWVRLQANPWRDPHEFTPLVESLRFK